MVFINTNFYNIYAGLQTSINIVKIGIYKYHSFFSFRCNCRSSLESAICYIQVEFPDRKTAIKNEQISCSSPDGRPVGTNCLACQVRGFISQQILCLCFTLTVCFTFHLFLFFKGIKHGNGSTVVCQREADPLSAGRKCLKKSRTLPFKSCVEHEIINVQVEECQPIYFDFVFDKSMCNCCSDKYFFFIFHSNYQQFFVQSSCQCLHWAGSKKCQHFSDEKNSGNSQISKFPIGLSAILISLSLRF